MVLGGWRRWGEGQSGFIASAESILKKEKKVDRQESHNHGGEGHTKSDTMENEKYMKSNTHTHERETE